MFVYVKFDFHMFLLYPWISFIFTPLNNSLNNKIPLLVLFFFPYSFLHFAKEGTIRNQEKDNSFSFQDPGYTINF